MSLRFRDATRADVPSVMALLMDDDVARGRETAAMEDYLAGFDVITEEDHSRIVVGEDEEGRIVATFQLTFLRGLSHRAARRALIEAVRIAAPLRSRGLGAALLAEAEARARAAGCVSMQLTTHNSRARAHAFYERLGYESHHLGYKKTL